LNREQGTPDQGTVDWEGVLGFRNVKHVFA